jgi:predicted glycosyltransferase
MAMNILFDLLHPADVNLFKNVVYSLKKQGHTVYLIYRERGALERIAKSEFPDLEVIKIGTHSKSISGKIYSLIKREYQAFLFFRKHKIDIVVCQGLASGIACKLLNIKILHYDDDSEYKLTYYMGKVFADIDVVPSFMPVSGKNIFKYKGYKELAYLHPDYFFPERTVLNDYNLLNSDYVFIREIASISINYQQNNALLPEIIRYLKEKNLKVVLSIENKALVDQFKENCIILKEPVKGLYSLIYYSKFVISSGDTMAREACVLGKTCIYTGGRTMLANSQFIDLGAMIKAETLDEVFPIIDKLDTTSYTNKVKENMKKLVSTEFEDTNTVLISQILRLKSKHN